MSSRDFFCCRITQRQDSQAVQFVLFVTDAQDVVSWSGVRRVGEHQHGTQRILKEARVRAIQRFISSEPRNTIPLSVLVAFDPGKAAFTSLQDRYAQCFPENGDAWRESDRVEWGSLRFDFDEDAEEHLRPALIVDGQHRIKGMASSPNEPLPVVVIALLDASADEQAFQFVVINNKSAKVPTDNVKAIIASINETDLRDRLLKAGVDYGGTSATLRDINEQEDSPFKGLLLWPLSGILENGVQLTTIESCLRYIRNQFPGMIDDTDTIKELFLTVWRVIRNHFNDLWKTDHKFMSKVNITAVNEFVFDRLAIGWENESVDIYDMASVEKQTENIVHMIPQEFWQVEWARPLQDNTVVRSAIKDDLRTIAQNRRAYHVDQRQWYVGLELVGEDLVLDADGK